MYTEHDYVIKASGVEELLDECRRAGLSFSAEKENAIAGALENARAKGDDVPLPFLNLAAGWDDGRGEYYAVIRNMYDPQNLLDILYERLLEKTENPGDELIVIRGHIDAYIGVIEQKEKISFAETRARLKEIAAGMRTTLAVYEDGEYTEDDFERLSDTLEKAYFDPIRGLLEGILVTIAGN